MIKIYLKKKCRICGQEFRPTSGNQKYCGNRCRKIAEEMSLGVANNNRKCDSQMCWDCQNATGSCSWSRELKPVKGWKAIKTNREGIPGHTYKILYCPLFKPDEY